VCVFSYCYSWRKRQQQRHNTLQETSTQFVYSTHTDQENNACHYNTVISYDSAINDKSTIIKDDKINPPSYEQATKFKFRFDLINFQN